LKTKKFFISDQIGKSYAEIDKLIYAISTVKTNPIDAIFLDYIQNLAPEGETALIVRQKPILADGELQLHADGAVKCTWPAYLPKHKRKDVCPNQ
jgi:hypothetical protein